MRILHVVCSDRFAGVEQFVLRLASAQAVSGHRVIVAGGASEQMVRALAPVGVTYQPAVTARNALAAVRDHRRNVDVVNTHMTAADGAAALALAAHRGPALVSTRHFALPRGGSLPRVITQMIEKRIDAEIAISTAVAAATGRPSTVVHTGVPAADAAPDARRVLMVQRLQPEKATDVGVRAFLASGLADEGWTLDVVGEGTERPALQHIIDRANAGSIVRLHGFRDDVADVMSHGGLFFAPCPREGLGIAVLEAMSHALPVIASGAGGHRDLLAELDPRCLFQPGSVDDAVLALRTFAADTVRRRAHAQAAQRRQQHLFTVAAQVVATDVVYQKAITRRRE